MSVIDREFKHATYHKISDTEDVHFIKEIKTHDDGTIEPTLTMRVNYERPFWVTKKPYRNHKQVKECEAIHKLDKFMSTESGLPKAIMKALRHPKFGNVSMRDVKMHPDSIYVYGADVDSITMLNLEYEEYGNKITPFSVGFLDIENNVDTGIISVITFIYRNTKDKRIKCITVINKQEMTDIHDAQSRVVNRFKEVLPNEVPKGFDVNDIDFAVSMHDEEKSLLEHLFSNIHKTNIDLLAGWNFLYDVSNMMKACIRVGIDYNRLFSHPSVPDKYKFLTIQEAASTKVKETGEVVSVPREERWHRFNSASMFKMVDYMAAFKFIRLQEHKLRGGYGFDNVMKSVGLGGKLKTVDLPPMSKYDWHKLMSRKYQLDYIVYNIWDTLGLLLKDEKDTDLSVKMPLLNEISSLNKFNSNPNRIYDKFYKLYLEEEKILANKLINKPELESLGREDWTITVNLWKYDPMFFQDIFEKNYTLDMPIDECSIKKLQDTGYSVNKSTSLSRLVMLLMDLDVTSSYPSCCEALNVSADTCVRELIDISNSKGAIEKEIMKHENIGLITGVGQDLSYASTMFNLPTLRELDTELSSFMTT